MLRHWLIYFFWTVIQLRPNLLLLNLLLICSLQKDNSTGIFSLLFLDVFNQNFCNRSTVKPNIVNEDRCILYRIFPLNNRSEIWHLRQISQSN